MPTSPRPTLPRLCPWIFAAALCWTGAAQAQRLIDPLMDGDEALAALSSMDCGAGAEGRPASYRAECAYGALAEGAAYFDACLPLMQERHGKILSASALERFYAPLRSWDAMAPASTRASVLDRGNNLRRSLAALATAKLSGLDDDALDEACAGRIAKIAMQAEPLALSDIVWSERDAPAAAASAQAPDATVEDEPRTGAAQPARSADPN